MKAKLMVVFFIFALGLLPAYAGEWLDEFDKADLDKEWFKITDRPEKQCTVSIEKGKLLLNEPMGNFGHLIVDGRPLVLRKAPKGDFSISMLIDTVPPAPAADYWIGLFIVGKDGNDVVLAENWAVLNIGGSRGEKKALIGSMIDNAWNDKGHFDIPGWPVYLKLEKSNTNFNGYYKENPADQWILVGAPWAHEMKAPELVGIGFINNWGGTNLTLTAEYFSLEGENVASMVVEAKDKLSNTWGRIKLTY